MPPKKPPTPLIEPGEGTVHEHHGKSGCDGNSITVTRAIEAAIEHRLLGPIPGTRELVLFLAEHKPFCNPLLSRILLSTPESSAASHKCRFRVRRFGRVFALPYKRPLTSSRCSTRSAAQCSAMQRNAAQCSAVQRSAVQCSLIGSGAPSLRTKVVRSSGLLPDLLQSLVRGVRWAAVRIAMCLAHAHCIACCQLVTSGGNRSPLLVLLSCGRLWLYV